MSLDAFSVLVFFLAAVEVVLGVAAVAIGVREARAPAGDDAVAEARRPLLALVAGTLLAVALASMPLLWLLLASWVPRWPGIMCVEGVRRIGTSSVGVAAKLPLLVHALDFTKPLLVFLAGAWLVLRRGGGRNAVRRAALAAVMLGGAAIVDGAAAGAYVAIPKEEIPAVGGCCMAAANETEREAGLTPAGASRDLDDTGRTALSFIAVASLLAAGAAIVARLPAAAGARTFLLAGLAAASLPKAVSFLADVAGPLLLGLPYHHCVWCAFATAPETIVGASLYLLGVFGAGWALVARIAAGGEDSDAGRRLLFVAAFGFAASAAMAAVIAYVR
jgi:hypothetical protein